jgi:hypothetical protein
VNHTPLVVTVVPLQVTSRSFVAATPFTLAAGAVYGVAAITLAPEHRSFGGGVRTTTRL